MLSVSNFDGADLVLIEGYASMPCPKIEVVRAARSTHLRCAGDDLLAVVSDVKHLDVTVPQLPLNDVTVVVDFIVQWGGLHG